MNDAATEVTVRVNGEARTLGPGTTLADLVPVEWARGVAVARNGEIVPRAQWGDTPVQAGDVIEIVRPVQGG
ncbi:MAG: sulfur carrier protein ThiS [Dehalococcoidia bacterium]|nr:MAG: sulfur carrier protein ThiS [Dehalococcoidia bacterium]